MVRRIRNPLSAFGITMLHRIVTLGIHQSVSRDRRPIRMLSRILLFACLIPILSVTSACDSRPTTKDANELIKQLRELQSKGRYPEMVGPSRRLVDLVCQI